MAPINTSKVVFLGLGLISGSLALALKRAGWLGRISAWGPELPVLSEAWRWA